MQRSKEEKRFIEWLFVMEKIPASQLFQKIPTLELEKLHAKHYADFCESEEKMKKMRAPKLSQNTQKRTEKNTISHQALKAGAQVYFLDFQNPLKKYPKGTIYKRFIKTARIAPGDYGNVKYFANIITNDVKKDKNEFRIIYCPLEHIFQTEEKALEFLKKIMPLE